jgi:hypothetical protein
MRNGGRSPFIDEKNPQEGKRSEGNGHRTPNLLCDLPDDIPELANVAIDEISKES